MTRDEIRVAVSGALGLNATSSKADADMLSAFFNKRFEFYGRKLSLLLYTPTGQSIPQELADAQAVDDMNVFADIGYQGGAAKDINGKEFWFYDELARRKIISVESQYTGPPLSDQAHLRRFHPYQWTYLPSVDQIQISYADFMCRSLKAYPAAYAGAGTDQTNPRKFGAVYYTYSDGTPPLDIAPLRDGLQRCGVNLTTSSVDANNGGPGDYSNIAVKMKIAGVTSIVPLIHTGPLGVELMPAASSQAYYPEWLVQNFIHQDDDAAANLYPSDQSSHMFGLRSMNKSVPASDNPWVWAYKEVSPAYDPGPNASFWNFMYWDLLLLSSGIQMAGPRLTPEAFGQALARTRFPNPGAGGPPYYQGAVGFTDGDHSMIDDFAVIWWRDGERSYDAASTKGAYCYAIRGQRFSVGEFPSRDPGIQQQPCR